MWRSLWRLFTSSTSLRRNHARLGASIWPWRGLGSRRFDAHGGTIKVAVRIRRSFGNVFRDVGFPPEEAARLLIRADLMIQLERIFKRRRLTQVQAAKLLGVSQPRVSDLVRGRIDLFSIDTLVDLLARLGVSVSVRTHRRKRVA